MTDSTELDSINNTIDILHNGLYDLTTRQKQELRCSVYKKLHHTDFKTIMEGRTINYYHIQMIQWLNYIFQVVDDEEEEALAAREHHDVASKFMESSEGIEYANEQVILFNLSELMDFLLQFRKGNITKHVDEYFDLVEQKICLYIRHTYDEATIDVVEYQQYTLDQIYHVSEGWVYDMFCFLNDVYNMIQFQHKIDAIPCISNTLTSKTIETFNQITENKFHIMNRFEFTSKYSKFEMEDMVMLYDIMKFKRVNNVLSVDINNVVMYQYPDYVAREVSNINTAPYKNECFLLYLFNQLFVDVDIYDYYERFYDANRLFDVQVNFMDRERDVSCFIIKSAPHSTYPYSVYIRSKEAKIVFNTFAEAMCYLGEHTQYNLFS